MSGNARDDLLPSQIPKWVDVYGEPGPDTTIPHHLLPFHIIRRLKDLTTNSTILHYMTEFMVKSRTHLTDKLGLVQGAWRKRVGEVVVDAGTILDFKMVVEAAPKICELFRILSDLIHILC